MMLPRVLSTLLIASLAGVAYGTSGSAVFGDTGLGSCGSVKQDSDHVVGLSPTDYAKGSTCGRQIAVHFQGKTVNVQVFNQCPTCSTGQIELSRSAFQQLANLNVGTIQVTWEFL